MANASAAVRCVNTTTCDAGSITYNSTKYDLTCSGLPGASCKHADDCDPLLKLDCAALYTDELDWAREAHCVNQTQCGQPAEDGANGTHVHVCYPGPPEEAKCDTVGEDCD